MAYKRNDVCRRSSVVNKLREDFFIMTTVKVKNVSTRTYMHLDIICKPNQVMNVPQEVADIWLKGGEIVKYAEPEDAEKLKAENEALKAKLAQAAKANKAQAPKGNKAAKANKAQA